ncbi:MAG: CBS domain-containing protein [Rhodospirillaceae bacterium]|nr:CBS domain-containing protein [Rhodospirillaceae bacterium]
MPNHVQQRLVPAEGKAMKSSDVMTQKVISIGPDASVSDAVQLMVKYHVSGLPVLDQDGRLQGIVTQGDFLRRSELGTEKRRPRWISFLLGLNTLAAEYVQRHGRKVSEIMTRSVAVVEEDTPLADVVELMERRHIKRLPVVRAGRVVAS